MQLSLPLQNRNDSYHSLGEDKLSKSRQTVYDCIRQHPHGLSDRDISIILGWPVNRVTGRRNELAEMHKIFSPSNRWDDETRRNVAIWKIRGE